MKRLSLGLGSAALILTLAGCMSGPPSDGGPIQTVRPTDAVQGQWFDTSGTSFSNFNGGVFETHASDTREKVAEGNYRFVSSNIVEIDLRSLARGTRSKVNCAIVGNGGQLNCTSDTNRQFSLTRRSA